MPLIYDFLSFLFFILLPAFCQIWSTFIFAIIKKKDKNLIKYESIREYGYTLPQIFQSRCGPISENSSSQNQYDKRKELVRQHYNQNNNMTLLERNKMTIKSRDIMGNSSQARGNEESSFSKASAGVGTSSSDLLYNQSLPQSLSKANNFIIYKEESPEENDEFDPDLTQDEFIQNQMVFNVNNSEVKNSTVETDTEENKFTF